MTIKKNTVGKTAKKAKAIAKSKKPAKTKKVKVQEPFTMAEIIHFRNFQS